MPRIEFIAKAYVDMDFDSCLILEANAMKQMETTDEYELCICEAMKRVEHDVEQVFGATTSLWTKGLEMRMTKDGAILSFRYRVIAGLECLFAGVCILRIGGGTESVTVNDITTAKHLCCEGRDSTELWKALRS